MPTYDYACAACGPFTAVQKIAVFDQPVSCPDCGNASARSFSVPDFLLGRKERVTRAADVSEREVGNYPRMLHGATVCACCPT